MFDFNIVEYRVYYDDFRKYVFKNYDDVVKCVRELIKLGYNDIRVFKLERCDIDVKSI